MEKNSYKDIKIFEDKKVSDLLKDIYDKTNDKGESIGNLIELITSKINNIEDISLLGPLVKDYVDLSIKNDKHLIDLGTLVQKIVYNNSKDDDKEDGIILSEQEKEELKKKTKDFLQSSKEISKEFSKLKKKNNGI